ncbi:MAG: exodeoxyribonuclease VII small subunit [Lachnospiraceae bacterium]|nr:exodeoxyribonuclease VII small subunit [Lachnospiraceae bacterium]
MAEKKTENTNPTNKERSLEENFAFLEETLQKLESNDIPLETAFGLYEEGMRALKECNEQIDRVEKKVLLLQSDGSTGEF